MGKDQKINQARELAGKLFDLKILDLELMKAEEQQRWMAQYPNLSRREFEDVRQQVIKAKTAHQSQIGWQVIPRDLAVIIFCLVSIVVNLSTGIVIGVAFLILFAPIFNIFYSERLNKILSYAVWFTYPALILLGYTLMRENYPWWLAIGIVVLAWVISFILDFVARITFQQFLTLKTQLKSKAKNEKHQK